jgi:endonuclease/exonuclease/phosphatase family metal-dependent hydrolase
MLPARIAVALLALLAAAACDPFNTRFRATEPAILYRSAAPAASPAPLTFPSTLRVMTWNVKYGGARLRFFWECDGDRTLMTEDEVNAHLDGIASEIAAVDPDVVLLQEVDTWRSKRVAWVDEVQGLLDRTGLAYGAYASQWKADYVPSDGEGPVDSGNAILSRWPITAATRHALALETDLSPLTRYFYLKRNLLETRIAIPVAGGGAREVAVVDLHAEAFSDDGTKWKHVESFRALVDGIRAAGTPVLGGGDFNSLPPGSDLRERFPEDQGCTGGRFEPDRYVGEEAILAPLFAAPWRADSPADACTIADGSRCTYVGDERFPLNRKLDHLFTAQSFAPATASQTVRQGAYLLSDHVPVVVGWEVP